jgi:hypothetical protein
LNLTEHFCSGIASGDPDVLRQRVVGEQSSASINLLCEFLTNPFGNVEQAREVLSQIESRSINDTELERGEFCFQIAFYFLACLAIGAHITDPISRNSCINRLYDRVRGFYARTDLTVKFSDFIVTVAERDQFVAGLPELLEKTGEEHGDISRAVMTKLGIFDLIGLRRLHGYRDVMGLPDSSLRFYLVAEQVLLHYGGKRYHPAVVAVIADLLSANYNILSKIVLSGSCQVSTQDVEPVEPFDSLPLDPSMPDISNKQPSKIYLAGEYLLLLVENVGPIGARASINFRYVLVVCDRRRELPKCFITLENSMSISNVLCVFEPNGSHSNYGALRGHNVLKEFLDKGMDLMRCRFDLGEIEELSSTRQPHSSSWKVYSGAAMDRAPARSHAAIRGAPRSQSAIGNSSRGFDKIARKVGTARSGSG